jgi:hypothetical protein
MRAAIGLLLPFLAACAQASWPSAVVRATDDFELAGDGSNAAWQKAEWLAMRRRAPELHPYETRLKILYSKSGLYVLMDGTDRTLTTTGRADFEDLWEEDVYEAFFWTDESDPLYFEYEISPLNRELPILIPNFGGQFLGWRPWHYEKDRLIRKATSISGGPKESGAAIQGWRAEFFIPYAVLRPLQNLPPKPGIRWRLNVYRMDYDEGKRTQWDWAPVGDSFHEYQKFGDLLFGNR